MPDHSKAYVRGFEHDIFISYAHVDDLSSPERAGWVSQFHEKFEDKLAMRKRWSVRIPEGVRQVIGKRLDTGDSTTGNMRAPTSPARAA